jgi:hypothetical protein
MGRKVPESRAAVPGHPGERGNFLEHEAEAPALRRAAAGCRRSAGQAQPVTLDAK